MRLCKRGKKGKLPSWKIERPAVFRELQRAEIELQVADFDGLNRCCAFPAAKRTYACRQLFHLEGFDQIVVCACVQPDHPILGLRPRRQQNDWPRVISVAQLGQQLQPAFAGQVDVQNYKIAVFLLEKQIGIVTVMNEIHRMTSVSQLIGYAFRQALVIFNQRNSHFFLFR